MTTVKKLLIAISALFFLGLGAVSSQTQEPQNLTVKNLTVIETLTVAGVANLARGLEVVGVLRSKNDANLKNAAQLELDSSQVPNGRRYTLTATLGGLLELRDETAGVVRLVLDANGQLQASLNASSITVGTMSMDRLPLGSLDSRYDGRYAFNSHNHDGRYYTQGEANSRFASSGHNHDDRYTFRGHDHDDRYYTKSTADNRYSPRSHDHDDRYLNKLGGTINGSLEMRHSYTGTFGLRVTMSGSDNRYGAIEGIHNGGGKGGIFVGGVTIDGRLEKSSGAFKIDHPLDPANKYLYHSFVESPDMMNLYNGIVTLDAQGTAWVDLPEWFMALNKEFRYGLTPIGAPMPNLYIAQEVKENRFQIAGGVPGKKVSWQVTGIRQDAYANADRIPVEELKPENERGFYLHPELFGQPEEKSVEWARNPEMMKQRRR